MDTLSKILPWVIVVLFGLLCAWVAWDLKPAHYIKGDSTHDTLTLPVDSLRIIKEATKGMIVGTQEELIQKYGSVIKRIDWSDSTRWNDSTRWTDSILFHIPTLETRDTMKYSTALPYESDSLHAQLRIRVHTLALLDPINAIENTIVVDSIKISIPPAVPISWIEIAQDYWYLPLAGVVAWEIIR